MITLLKINCALKKKGKNFLVSIEFLYSSQVANKKKKLEKQKKNFLFVLFFQQQERNTSIFVGFYQAWVWRKNLYQNYNNFYIQMSEK